MFVGNQVLLGLDQFVLVTLLYNRFGFFCRRMHDTLFGKIPLLRELVGTVSCGWWWWTYGWW